MEYERPARMSVPQFGGWDQNEPGATDYSYTVVFTQARENKKHQKTNLTEIKHNQENSVHAHHGHAHHHHVHGHGHGHGHGRGHANGYPIVMGKKRILTYINCCIRPTIAAP